MKIVFILPPSPWLISDRDQPLTGALYVVAALKCLGYEVQVCDLAGLPEDYWHIPIGDIYGVTVTSTHFPYMSRIIEKLKARNPNCIVMIGGVHATVAYEHKYPEYLRRLWCGLVVPWKVGRKRVDADRSVVYHGAPIISLVPESRIEIGARSVLCSHSAYTALGASHPVVLRTLRPGATIRIGADVGISGATICAAQ